jgi:hypothetical protein
LASLSLLTRRRTTLWTRCPTRYRSTSTLALTLTLTLTLALTLALTLTSPPNPNPNPDPNPNPEPTKVEQLFKALQFHERKGWEAAVRSGTEADERPDVLVLPVCSSPATRPSPVLYPPFARYPSLTRYPPFARYPSLTRYAPLTRYPPLSSATIPWPCYYHSNVATACLLPTNPYPCDGRPLPLTLATAAPYPLPYRRPLNLPQPRPLPGADRRGRRHRPRRPDCGDETHHDLTLTRIRALTRTRTRTRARARTR